MLQNPQTNTGREFAAPIHPAGDFLGRVRSIPRRRSAGKGLRRAVRVRRWTGHGWRRRLRLVAAEALAPGDEQQKHQERQWSKAGQSVKGHA